MTFIGILKNSSRVRVSPDEFKGGDIGGIVGDGRKIFTQEAPGGEEYVQRPNDSFVKVERIEGKSLDGYMGWEGDPDFVDTVLKHMRTCSHLQFTPYGNELARFTREHMDTLASLSSQGKTDGVEVRQAQTFTFLQNLSRFGLIAFDSSEDDQQLRIGQVFWQRQPVNNFVFKHVGEDHLELGCWGAREAGRRHLEQKLSDWSHIPIYKLSHLHILGALAGEYQEALENPTVSGSPTFVLRYNGVWTPYSPEEGCGLVTLVGHWNKGIIKPEYWGQGEKWLYNALQKIADHNIDYELIGDAALRHPHDVRTSCLIPSQLDKKYRDALAAGNIIGRGQNGSR